MKNGWCFVLRWLWQTKFMSTEDVKESNEHVSFLMSERCALQVQLWESEKTEHHWIISLVCYSFFALFHFCGYFISRPQRKWWLHHASVIFLMLVCFTLSGVYILRDMFVEHAQRQCVVFTAISNTNDFFAHKFANMCMFRDDKGDERTEKRCVWANATLKTELDGHTSSHFWQISEIHGFPQSRHT